MDYLDNEIWEKIDGYEEYFVSNHGNIKSTKRGVEKILKPAKDKKRGYLRVNLWKNHKGHSYTVHKLVANAFIPNPNNLPQINHKDENKENNHIKNLEYCTNKYNLNYGTRKERISKKRGKPVIQFDLNMNFIKKWNGTIQASKQTGINEGNIWECCNHKRKTARGYVWKYEEEMQYGEYV